MGEAPTHPDRLLVKTQTRSVIPGERAWLSLWVGLEVAQGVKGPLQPQGPAPPALCDGSSASLDLLFLPYL